MTYQSGRNIEVGHKLETVFGQKPGATGADYFRPNSSPGLTLSKDTIQSNENRRDGMMTRARHGSITVGGSYNADLSLGSYDKWIEAVFRGTFDTALTITEATAGLTSVTTTAHTIVASAGSWITAGLRVGDVIRPAGLSDAANNGKNMRLTAVTPLVLTVAEDLVVNAVADTAFTITRPKKLIQGVTPRSFMIEEREIDIDDSEVFLGCRIGQLQVQLQPNGMCTLTFTVVGQNGEILEGAASPYFTAPVETTSIGMTSVEAVIRLGDEDVLDVTSVNLAIDLKAAGVPVVGSNITPEIFTNLAAVTGSVTALKKGTARQQQFLTEEGLSLHLLFTEPESDPQDFCSFFVGNLTLGSASKSDLGSDNGRTQSFDLLIGKDQRGGAYDPTMVKYQTSAV